MAIVKKETVMVKKVKPKKKKKSYDVNGVAHIHATANNTIVSIATEKGEIIT
jgi:ribosomal protein S11